MDFNYSLTWSVPQVKSKSLVLKSLGENNCDSWD